MITDVIILFHILYWLAYGIPFRMYELKLVWDTTC